MAFHFGGGGARAFSAKRGVARQHSFMPILHLVRSGSLNKWKEIFDPLFWNLILVEKKGLLCFASLVDPQTNFLPSPPL